MSRNIPLILAASLALAGCNMAAQTEEQFDDSRNPHYKQAQADLDNNQPLAAASDYESALVADPKLAGAHYQLGHIYGDKLNDPIASIFHYQQYLKLAPSGDKAEDAKALIEKQGQAFAASLPNSPAQGPDDYARLQADNAVLKKQVSAATLTITKLQAQLGKRHHQTAVAAASISIPAAGPALADDTASSAAPATPATPAGSPTPTSGVAAPTDMAPATTNAASSTPPRALPLDATNVITGTTPAADAGPSRSYKVVKGDSLWKIAHKMYPHDTLNGEDKIRDANKDVFNGKFLQPGQVLVIPQ